MKPPLKDPNLIVISECFHRGRLIKWFNDIVATNFPPHSIGRVTMTMKMMIFPLDSFQNNSEAELLVRKFTSPCTADFCSLFKYAIVLVKGRNLADG